jgi:chitodextrinase
MKVRRLALSASAALAVLAVAVPASSAPRPNRTKPDVTPPTVPTNVRITAATEDSISLAWSPSSDNSGSVHHYVTCYSGFMIPGAWCIWGPPDPPAKTVTGLVPGKEFSFRVKAVDAAGNESALSNPVSGTTAPDVTPPTTPANLRVTATTPSSVSLAWDRSSDNWAFRYQVLMDGEVVGSTDSLAFRQRHLAPGSAHVFAVRARDSSGNLSGNSNAVTVTLEESSDRTPPTTPTNLTASQPADDFCGTNLLQWNASTDDLDAQSAIEYEIYLNGSLFTVGPPGVTFSSPYTPAGTNTWTVVAVDRAGNSSGTSNAATLTVQADPNLC